MVPRNTSMALNRMVFKMGTPLFAVISAPRHAAHTVSVCDLHSAVSLRAVFSSCVVTKLRLGDARTRVLCVANCLCVVRMKPLFLAVDIQHNQYPCRFFQSWRVATYYTSKYNAITGGP